MHPHCQFRYEMAAALPVEQKQRVAGVIRKTLVCTPEVRGAQSFCPRLHAKNAGFVFNSESIRQGFRSVSLRVVFVTHEIPPRLDQKQVFKNQVRPAYPLTNRQTKAFVGQTSFACSLLFTTQYNEITKHVLRIYFRPATSRSPLSQGRFYQCYSQRINACYKQLRPSKQAHQLTR